MTAVAALCWFSPSELAGLPGLPGSKRKVNERALAEGWAGKVGDDGAPLSRKRAGRGGGMEYHVDLLPEAARRKLARLNAPVAVALLATTPVTAGEYDSRWKWFEGQSAKTKRDAADRLAVIQDYERRVALGASRTSAAKAIAREGKASTGSLANWLKEIRDVPVAHRLPFLASSYAGGRDAAEIDADALKLLKSLYLTLSGPSWASCYRRMIDDYAAPNGVVVPDLKTFQRRIRQELGSDWRQYEIKMRKGADALQKTIPSQRRTVADLHALYAVNIDGHTFDVFCEWPDGTIARPVIVGIQDVYSRKILAWRIGRTENALLTRGAFIDLFRDYGIPQKCVMDNGRAFAAKSVTGGAKSRYRFKIKEEDTTGFLIALGVDPNWTIPYNGQAKPIERMWGDLEEEVGKSPFCIGAYTGNKPTAKPENYGSKSVKIEEFIAYASHEIVRGNARPGRETEMGAGIYSFDDVWQRSIKAGAPIGKASDMQMRMAMLTAEPRKCDPKTGEITMDGNRYYAKELAQYAGKRMVVRFDPDNLHGSVHVYTLDDDYVCEAPVIRPEGFFSKDAAKRRAKQKADLRKHIRAVHESQDLLDAAEMADLLSGPTAPAPVPTPTVVRAVRHRRTAAALKPVPQIAPAAAQPDFDAGFIAAVRALRVVGE